MSSDLQVEDALSSAAAHALHRGAEALARLQRPEGFWWADLTSDSTLESDWFSLLLWMHPPAADGSWNPPNPERIARAADSILARQLPGGGFAIYPGGPAEIKASVKAYFALKLAGIDPGSEPMTRLRRVILDLGGVQAANTYVKVNLALFGLFPGRHVPAIPPELLLLPGNVVYRMSAWTRAIVIPLSVLYATTIASGQTRPAPAGFHLEEIFHPGKPLETPSTASGLSWPGFFHTLNGYLKRQEGRAPDARRLRALEQAKRWILRHLDKSDGLAAIYPAMQYTVMALEALGLPADSPERAKAQREFDRLLTDDGRRFYFQPCFSPIWDTAIAAYTLAVAGDAGSNELRRASEWLVSKEVRSKGDWSVRRPDIEPSGWYFEFANEFYPDVDDTAMVLLALKHAAPEHGGAGQAAARAIHWVESMQAPSGGWAAFDGGDNWAFLEHVPFADHNAMLDPACPDITGRVLEALCAWGATPSSPAVQRGIQFLLDSQEQRDGSWYGRWGVNYIYGTCHALRGLRAAGYDDHEAAVLRGGEWLRSVQNADGGWGESCASYDEGAFVPAPSTPSQTAWAVMGLIAGGDTTSESVRKGVEYLASTQREDGSWPEDAATGTGFPRVFYLRYHLYPQAFPVLALTEFMKTRTQFGGDRG